MIKNFKKMILKTNYKKIINYYNNYNFKDNIFFDGDPGYGTFIIAIFFIKLITTNNVNIKFNLKNFVINNPYTYYIFPIDVSNTKNDYIYDKWIEFIIDNPYSNIVYWEKYLKIKNKFLQIGIKQINDLYNEFFITTLYTKYNIILMWIIEKINDTAMNKLINILDNKPKNLIFIFLGNLGKLNNKFNNIKYNLFNINILNNNNIQKTLKLNNINKKKRNLITILSEGNIQNIIDIQNKDIYYDYLISISKIMFYIRKMKSNYNKYILKIISYIDIIDNKWFKEKKNGFFTLLLELYRKILINLYIKLYEKYLKIVLKNINLKDNNIYNYYNLSKIRIILENYKNRFNNNNKFKLILLNLIIKLYNIFFK